jgi:iron complex transport system permease protein
MQGLHVIGKGMEIVMQEKRKYRYIIAFIFLVIAVLVLLVLNICIGSVGIALPDVINALTGNAENENNIRIIWDIRLPRIIAVLILGGALALSGYLLQTFFHNPIAGPFVLGISSGAKMVVAIVMVFLMGKSIKVTSADMIVAAFIGALISMGFVLILSNRVQGMSMLVVSGVMIGYICSAITELIVTFAEDADIVNLHNWSRGSFSGMTWDNVKIMAVLVAVTFVVVFMMSKPLNAYQLGEVYARNMGVNIKILRILLVILSSILSACVVAFAGPISFVGIATPHLVKKLMGTAKPIYMIPACFLGGSVFCLISDLIARTVLAPSELSISTVTAIFGAPVVLWVIADRKRERT